MAYHKKSAWLIGLYTPDIEHRIESLGYRLTRCYADVDFKQESNDKPGLIVFSEDEFSDPDWMFLLRHSYPESVMITLPIHTTLQTYVYSGIGEPRTSSIQRLITSIQEREHRWDN